VDQEAQTVPLNPEEFLPFVTDEAALRTYSTEALLAELGARCNGGTSYLSDFSCSAP
jgi:hypothetical protein